MMSLFRNQRVRLAAPFIVLILGFGLRCMMVPDARFTGDEASF